MLKNSALAAGLGLALGILSSGLVFAASSEIRIGMTLEPPILDPTANAAAPIDDIVYQNIFEGLTQIDQTGAVQPDLATSWTVSPDNLTFTFTLAPNVTFHDGTTFDADDVKFTFDRILAPDSLNAQKALYEPIESVTVTDPHTVAIKLKRPTGDFLFNIGRGDAVIVAPESAATNATKPVGTGPFKFVQWDKGSRIILAKNDTYWGKPVALTKATFVFIPDAAAATNALLAGDVDGIKNISTDTVAIFTGNPQFKVLVGTTEGETVLATNNAKKPFSDLRVRQAMAHAIDRKAIIDGAQNGYGTPIGSHFSPVHPYYIDLTGTYPFDLVKAKELLTEAGYPDGFSATLKLPPTQYARLSGQIIASDFAKIGIKLEQINVEWAQWLEDVFTKHDYDLSIVAHVEPFDIGIYANPDYYFGYNDPEFQEIMKKLNATVDDAARKDLAIQAQKRLAEQAVNGFLFEFPQVGVWNAKIEGQWQNAPIEGTPLRDVHWVD
jgi:peptide/nickel transport system substrate-binding protein